MLVAIVGFCMLLSIAPIPDGYRMAVSSLPALILCGWLLDFPGKLARSLLVTLTLVTLLIALYSVTTRRPHPVGILSTPQGKLAFTDPILYREDTWIQQHTRPLDYFYEPASQAEYFYLDLRNPAPLSVVENNGYTPSDQVSEVIQSLKQHSVRYILWSPVILDSLPKMRKPGEDHLAPLREYVYSNYQLVNVFENSDEIWEKKSE
jgi:hypothetical protein